MKTETRVVEATLLRKSVTWRRTATVAPLALGVTFCALACGDDIQGNPSGVDGPLGVVVVPTQTPTATDPNTATNSPTGPTPIDGPSFDPNAPTAATDPNMMGCAGEMSQAETPGLDMYVVLDHTGSMGVDCPLDLATSPVVPPTNNPDDNKWCFASHALGQYFTSSIAIGNRAALQFMSVENEFATAVAGADAYVCDAGDNNPHATAHVGLTTLPVDVANPLIQALSDDDPQAPLNVFPRAGGGGGGGGGLGGLGTRVEAALRGITTFTAANQDIVRTMIGILITDGDPNGCEEDPNVLAQIVGDHLAQTGLRTFIIGMTGASLDNLEIIAAAGGAPVHGPEFCGNDAAGNPIPSCSYWSVGDGDPTAFVSALEQIQQVALLPCDYTIPPPPIGQRLDLNEVNVIFTPPDVPMGTTIGRVNDETACGATGGVGWFYDDPVNATTIRLCDASCNSAMTAADGTSINVQFGCATILQ